MKHLKTGRKFSREKKQREALLKTMLGDLIVKRKMKTTLAKAKELKMIGEKMIGQLKDPQALRLLKSRLPRNISPAIIRELAAATASRKSGYLRVTKLGARLSDSAQMAKLEIIEDKIAADSKK
ncbi:MAG TPA: L17 family ribosomal protein [Candidatus Bathyarchaeia archaeon]|nr:L17 family ribosomal protein [Candidatus Bathyarchaeia archaeon]